MFARIGTDISILFEGTADLKVGSFASLRTSTKSALGVKYPPPLPVKGLKSTRRDILKQVNTFSFLRIFSDSAINAIKFPYYCLIDAFIR